MIIVAGPPFKAAGSEGKNALLGRSSVLRASVRENGLVHGRGQGDILEAEDRRLAIETVERRYPDRAELAPAFPGGGLSGRLHALEQKFPLVHEMGLSVHVEPVVVSGSQTHAVIEREIEHVPLHAAGPFL